MKKILQGLFALMICGALNFGLTNDAQAAEFDSSIGISGTENSEFMRSHHGDWGEPPPPPPPHHRRLPPPPPDYWDYAPPPPPPRGGWGEPPPPPPPRHHRW